MAPRRTSSTLGWEAAVMEMVSPSQLKPASNGANVRGLVASGRGSHTSGRVQPLNESSLCKKEAACGPALDSHRFEQ